MNMRPGEKAAHQELASLITSAQGRTLALFTSYESLHAARNFLSEQIDLPILCRRYARENFWKSSLRPAKHLFSEPEDSGKALMLPDKH